MKQRAAIVVVLLLIAAAVGANESPCTTAQLRTIASAVELYNAKQSAYPAQQGWMAALKGAGILSRDFPEKDHWGNPFFYRAVGATQLDLRAIGPDQRWGTEDDQVKADDGSGRRARSAVAEVALPRRNADGEPRPVAQARREALKTGALALFVASGAAGHARQPLAAAILWPRNAASISGQGGLWPRTRGSTTKHGH